MQVTEEQPSTSFPQERASCHHDSNIQLDDDASPVLLGLERDSFHIKKQLDKKVCEQTLKLACESLTFYLVLKASSLKYEVYIKKIDR